jgi:hypothetical protein
MPRVVPSQVVGLIERLFPPENQHKQGFSLVREDSGRFMAILELIEKIPQELITIDAPDYTDLIIGITTLRSAISQWQLHTQALRGVPGHGGTSPITLIYRVLLKCPDEFPSSGTAELNFLVPNDLRDNLRLDISAANRALANSEWKAK